MPPLLLATHSLTSSRSFFGGYHPIDFHSTTVQAMKPAAVAKLMFWLASFSLAGAHKTTPDKVDRDMVLKMLDWNEAQMETPRWAVLSDSYAATTTGVSSPTPSPAVCLPPHLLPSSIRY
jgi:hypothetical protein